MIDYFSSDEYIAPECGDILISEPYLPDPNFERSVILLCEHNDEGSLGFVLNQPTEVKLTEVLEEANIKDSIVHIGGPVQKETLHFIHSLKSPLKNDVQINEGVYWGGDFNSLLSAVNLGVVEPNQVKFFIGYSGWSPGQLEEEIKAKSWIVCKKVTLDLVFNLESEQQWREVLVRMGGKFKMIANYPADPSLN